LKNSQHAEPTAAPDMVPRTRLEDAEKRLAQTERNYQQLLKTLNRNLNARASGRAPPAADVLKRRDVN
jgi:hypothetical protein